VASRAERSAKNESLFREVNERVAMVAEQFRAGEFEVFCECSSAGCPAMIKITPTEYTAVRSRGERFALLAGHDDPAVERVVEQNERFVVVEKFGEGAEIARELDPRSD
jgi:alpha-D-ribose 1-methylphosphonate 5-triphosphate diphosphatase PhnM